MFSKVTPRRQLSRIDREKRASFRDGSSASVKRAPISHKPVFWLTSCSLQSGTDHLVAQAKHWKDAPLPSEVYTANVPNVSERWLPAGLRWVWAQNRAGHTCDERLPHRVAFRSRDGKGGRNSTHGYLDVSRAWDDTSAATWVAKTSPATVLCTLPHSSNIIRDPFDDLLKTGITAKFSKNGSISSAR